MNASIVTSPGSADQRFAAETHDRSRQQALVGCLLVLVCMPLGWTLDWFVYPQQLWHFFFVSRLGCDVLVLPLAYILYRRACSGRAIEFIGMLWPVLPALSISYMIFQTEGVSSGYYAGINLVLIVACLLMPYTLGQAALVCGASTSIYLIACLLHWNQTGHVPPASIVFSNLYFISITSLICVVACYTSTALRRREFDLRDQVAQKGNQLQLANANLGQANEQLQQNVEKLAQLDRLKSQFFANVSHELRTPLTLILAPIEDLLHDQRLTASRKQLDSLHLVQDNAQRLLHLINDLLDLVRFGEGTLRLQKAHVDLSTLLGGLADSVAHLARTKEIQLRRQGPGHLVARLDPSRIERVVLNLLTNAVKFTPPQGTIDLNWSATGRDIRITVTDTGPGIPEDQRERVFDRFHQVDGSITRSHQGLGLGLTIVRELVEAHGGTVQVEPGPTGGARFVVDLPDAIVPADQASEPLIQHAPRAASSDDPVRALQPAIYPQPAAAPPATPDAPYVLIADDEPAMRAYLESSLTRAADAFADPLQFVVVNDGQAALDVSHQRPPQLVVLDLMMPRLDGLSVVRALRADARFQSTRILLLTARGDEQAKIDALSAGADDFLTKPFGSSELQTRVVNLLRRNRLEQQLVDKNAALAKTLDQLKQTEAQLVHAAKMNALGTLVAGLLHEINNPLNYMLMAVQLAQQMAGQDKSLQEVLRDLDEGARRIHTITSDLRAFAYPSERDLNSTFVLSEAVTTAGRMLASILKDVRFEAGDGLDLPVMASKTHITQVLVNLLSNAIYACQKLEGLRPGRVTVSAARESGRVVVRVTDNGTGIPPALQPRIFEPFFTSKDVGQGTGLGLSICYTIIHNHGGTINVECTSQGGTCIRFDLQSADPAAVSHRSIPENGVTL
jgi:signal transduction histidine kinase